MSDETKNNQGAGNETLNIPVEETFDASITINKSQKPTIEMVGEVEPKINKQSRGTIIKDLKDLGAILEVTPQTKTTTSNVRPPTIEQEAIVKVTPRLEQSTAFIKQFIADSAKAVEVKPAFDGKHAFSSKTSRASIGVPTINEALDSGRDVDEFKLHLEKALERGRVSSSSKRMLDLAKNAANAGQPTLTVDVENTFTKAKSGPLLSASYKPSGSPQVTLINEDYAKLGKQNIDYWKKQGNVGNQQMMEQVVAKLHESYAKAMAGDASFKVVSPTVMKASLAGAINSNPKSIIQGVNFETDAKKISDFIGSATPETASAVTALVGNATTPPRTRSLETQFRRRFQLPSVYSRGQSVTAMADMLGVLPKSGTSELHGSNVDVEVSENIGAILDSLDSHEASYGRDNSTKPSPIVSALQKRVNKPGFVEGWRGRTVADAAVKRLTKIQSGSLYASPEDAALEAHSLIESTRSSNAGSLLSLTSPTTNIQSDGLTLEQKKKIAKEQYGAEFTGKPEGIAATTLNIAKEQSKVNRVIPLTSEEIGDTTSNLDAAMKRYALQATDNLRVKAMSNGGRISAEAIDQEIASLSKNVTADFGPNIRTNEGHYPGDAGLNSTFALSLQKFPSKQFVEDTKGQIGFKPENAAVLTQAIYSKLRGSLSSKDAHLASMDTEGNRLPLSIDTAISGYLSPEVLETPLTQKAAVAEHLSSNSRAVGLKAISGHIFENITAPSEPSSDDPYGKKVVLKSNVDRKKIATDILEAQQTGTFKPNLASHLTSVTGTETSRDMISALEELRSKRYMAQGNAFEQSIVSGQDNFLAENGYTPVVNKFTGKLEHEGKIGNLTGGAEDLVGHPDLLASRVEKRGTNWQRRYTLADVKSPQTPVAPGSTLSSLIEDKDRGKWLSQVLTYAQMLPEDIRSNLDIGILAGGPGQKTRMIKDSYENISQHPVAKEILAQLHGGTQGQVGKLESLPSDYLKPGETNKKNFTATELNHVAKVSDTSTKAQESYIRTITDLAKNKKIEGASTKELLIQYDTKGIGGNEPSPLKARLDALQKTHNVEGGLFGKLPENDFNALSLSLLQQTANTDKSKRVSGLEDAITNPQLKALDSVTAHFKGLELQIQSAQKKADTEVQTKVANLEGYRFNLGAGGANFFRGAFASEGVRGHKGENKDLKTLTGDWQEKPAAEGPGAQAFADAERRARLAKVYLNRYNSADLRAQMLVHGGEAKLAARGTSGDTNFLQEFMTPGAAKPKSKDKKTTSYGDELDRSLQERAYYGAQLGTLSESKTMDDALVKLNASRQDKNVQQQAIGLDRAAGLLNGMHDLRSDRKGIQASQYSREYSRLQQSGLTEKELTQVGLSKPADIIEANKHDEMFMQGYTGSEAARGNNKANLDLLNSLTAGGVSGEEYDGLAKKRARLTLNRKLATHTADYLESNYDTDSSKSLAGEKRKTAETAGMEEAALNDFLLKQGSTPKTSRFHTPESALREVEGNREDKLTKHVNNALMAQEEATKFGLTPQLLDTLSSSVSGIQSLGGSSASHGIDLAGLLAGTKTKGFTGSSILNKLETGASGEQSYTDKYLHANKQEAYISSLHSELGSLTGGVKVDTPFKELGLAIEEDLQKLRTLKEESKGLDHTSPEFAKNKLARTVIEDRLTDNLTSIKTADSGHTPGPDYSKDYEQQKGLLTAKAMDSSAMLAAALGANDFSPELLKSINKQNKVNTSLGINDPGLQASEVFSHYQTYITDPNKRKDAIDNVDLSNNALKFTASAQVVGNYKTNPSQVGTSDINVFDALHQKEQSALKVVNDLRTALIEVGGTKLTGLEDQFLQLYKNIEVSIAELQQLEAVGSQAPAHKQLLQDKRSQIAGQIDELDTTRQQIVQKRPTLDANAWNAMKVQAGTQSTIDEYDVVRKAMSANAKIQSLGERASYSDFKEAHDTAKELRQRNIPIVNNPGLMTEKEVEQHASKSGKTFFEGQQHVNFTEQLVDLANWQVQWAGATAVTQGFTTALYGGFGAAKEFEASMKDVELISQATSVQMEGLKNKVMDLGSNFKVPVKELADGLVILGQAGFKASDSIQMIQPISQLAVATGSSHKQASDITTSVMMAYDQPSTSTADVTNALAATTIESKLELGSLGTTFNYIGATAAMAGLSLEETATAMGLMSNAGVRASTIGTSLRSILGALIAPTANFKAELGRVGISIDELNPRTNNLGSILTKLNTKGFSVENAFEGMNKREAGAMTSLLNQGDKWGDFKGRISGTDRAETMAVGQMDTYDAQMKRLENQTKIAGIKVFQGSMDPLKTSAKVMSFGFEAIGELADSSFGKATTSIMSTALAAMTATTIISTLGKALWLVAPAAGAGIGKSWGMGDIGKLPEDPRRKRIYEGVQSLAGIGFNPWAVGAAVGLTAMAYTGQKMYNGDKILGLDTNASWNPLNQGITPLKRETGKADFIGNLLETVNTAAKQQPDAELFDKGNDAERKSYISSLVNTGLLSGTDRFGKLVDPEMVRRRKSEPAKDLIVDSGKLDLKEFAAGMTSYSDFAVTPTLLRQVAKTGNNQITKQEDLYSDKGKNYVQYAADKYIEAMKQKNIYYNPQESSKYLDEFLGGSISDDAIKSNIKEKQDIAYKSKERPDIEKSSNKEFFKRSAATAFGIQEIIDRPTSTVAISRKAASEKTFIEGELNDETAKATLKDQKPYRDIINKRKAAYDKAINTGDTVQIAGAQDKLLTAMETLSQVQGLESFSGVKGRAKESYDSQFSPKALKAANETMSQAYTRVITDSPELAKTKGEYSTAGELFNEKKTKGVVEYGNVLRQLKAAQDDLSASEAKGGTGTDEYKTKQLQVRAYQMRLEELGASMKRLQLESYKFGMSEVNYKLIPTVMDLKYPAKFANEKPITNMMQYMPTVAIEDFRQKSVALEKKYLPLKDEAMIAGDYKAIAKVDLAWKLEIQDMEEELISKATIKVKEAGDKLEGIIGREFQNRTLNIQLKTDLATTDIDIKAADAKMSSLLAPRDIIKGQQKAAAVDYTKYGYPNFQPYPGVQAWSKNASLFDTSGYSADTGFTDTIVAEMDKLKLSKGSNVEIMNAALEAASNTRLQGIKTAYATTAPGMSYKLPQTPAEAVDGSNAPETTKLKLIDVEEKYQQARISASSKALQSIRKDIEAELKLRDQLLEKMKGLDDSKQDFAKGVDSRNKELRKASGLDVRERPEQMMSDMNSLIDKAKVYAKEGKVDKVKEIDQQMAEKSRTLATEEYGSYWRMEGTKKNDQMVPIYNEAVANRKTIYGEKVEQISRDTVNDPKTMATWATSVRDSIKTSSGLSDEEKTIRTKNFDERLAAAGSDPEKMKQIISAERAHSEIAGETTGAEAFRNLTASSELLTSKFKDLIPVLEQLMGMTGKGTIDQDVTPTKASLKDLVGETAFKQLGLDTIPENKLPVITRRQAGTIKGPGGINLDEVTSEDGKSVQYTDRNSLIHGMSHVKDIVAGASYPIKSMEAEYKADSATDMSDSRFQAKHGLPRGLDISNISSEQRNKLYSSRNSEAYKGLYSVAEQQAANIVVDRESNMLSVIQGQKVLTQFPVLTGKQRGDIGGTKRLKDPTFNEKDKVTPPGTWPLKVDTKNDSEYGGYSLNLEGTGGVAIHNIANVPGEDRVKRIKSKVAADRRITYGYINAAVEDKKKLDKLVDQGVLNNSSKVTVTSDTMAAEVAPSTGFSLVSEATAAEIKPIKAITPTVQKITTPNVQKITTPAEVVAEDYNNIPSGLENYNFDGTPTEPVEIPKKVKKKKKGELTLSDLVTETPVEGDVQSVINANKEPLSYVKSANKAFGTDIPEKGNSIQRFISQAAHTILPPAMATVGGIVAGLAATPETLAVGTIPAGIVGAGLGWAGGKEMARLGDRAMGLGQNRTIPQMAGNLAYDTLEGMTFEMGGQLLGKGVEIASPYAKQFLSPIFSKAKPAFVGPIRPITKSARSNREFIHTSKNGPLEGVASMEGKKPLYVSPAHDVEASIARIDEGATDVVSYGVTLDKDAYIFDIYKASAKELKTYQKALTKQYLKQPGWKPRTATKRAKDVINKQRNDPESWKAIERDGGILPDEVLGAYEEMGVSAYTFKDSTMKGAAPALGIVNPSKATVREMTTGRIINKSAGFEPTEATKISDIAWNDLRGTLQGLTQTHTRTGRPIRSDWKNDVGLPGKRFGNVKDGLQVEPGYAYRNVSEAEARALAEDGVLTPPAKYDNVPVGTPNKGHKQTTKKMWSQYDTAGPGYAPGNTILKVPIDKVPTVPGQMVKAEDIQVMRFNKESGAWEGTPGASSTETYIEDTLKNIKLGKAGKGLGKKALDAQNLAAKELVAGPKVAPAPTTLDSLEGIASTMPEESVSQAVKESVSPGKWEKIKSFTPGNMLKRLTNKEQTALMQNAAVKSAAISSYLGVPPLLSAMFKEEPKKELTPEEQLKETETRGMDNARKNWAAADTQSKAKAEAKVVQQEADTKAKEKENIHQSVLNPALMAEGTFDEMRSKMETQQRPYDILAGDDKQYKGKAGLKKYFTQMGLSKSEVKAKVQETIDTAGQKDEGQIKSVDNNTGPGLKPKGSIIDNVLSTQDTPEMAKWKADNAPQKGSLTLGLPDSLNAPFRLARGGSALTPEELAATGTDVTPAKSAIGQVDAAIKAPYGSLAADSNPYSSMVADYNPYSSMSADLPKTAAQVKKSVYSLSDQAPQGQLATLTNQTMQTPGLNEAQAASNEKLIASLDQLRSAVEKISGTASATQGSTGASASGGVSVQVNAPITVATSTNNGGGTQDVSATVTKICTEFFNNEFTNRYIAAVNNTSVN